MAESKTLEQQLQQPDEFRRGQNWDPEIGDQLIGMLVSYRKYKTRFGIRWLAHIKDNLGSLWTVWLSHMVLAGEFARLRPEKGERVGVKRLENHGRCKRFRVVVEGREGCEEQPDWDSFQLPEEQKTETPSEPDQVSDDEMPF